jgi:hypothetical protein
MSSPQRGSDQRMADSSVEPGVLTGQRRAHGSLPTHGFGTAPSSGSSSPHRPGRAFALAASLLMVLSALLLLPAASAAYPAAIPVSAGGGSSALISGELSHAASGSPFTRAAGPFYGQNPSDEPLAPAFSHILPTSAPFTAAQIARDAADAVAHGVPQTTPTPSGSASATLGPSAAALRLGAAAPNVLATATGTILNTTYPHAAISGVLVTVAPVGNACQNSSCPPVYTTNSGYFSVKILQGADQLNFCAGWYVCNYTLITNVTAGSTYSLGVIYLVPDGIVFGVVRGNDSSHEPVCQVQVTGSTRDNKITATPSVITCGTGVQGGFKAPVPPGPSELQFAPLAKWGLYFGTTVYTDLQPGQVYNLGTVYLQVGVVVTVQPRNAETGKALSGLGYVAATGCARNEPGLCFAQGTVVPLGSTPSFVAPAGPDTVQVMADGYISNTSTAYVPQLAPGHRYNLGIVYLVPDAGVAVHVDITWHNTPAEKAAEAKWGVGRGGCPFGPSCIVVGASSMDGYALSAEMMNSYFGINMTTTTGGTICLNPGQTGVVAVAPLRSSLHAYPDTGTSCNPFGPTWPIPNQLPVSDNYTWVNATAGRILTGVEEDLTPGTYVQGTVLPSGAPWTASACSTDEVNLCFPTSQNTTALSSLNILPNGCGVSPSTFCAPVPAGPVKISITSTDYPTNFTMAYNPPGRWNAMPLPLATASANGISTIRLSHGIIIGEVRDSVTNQAPRGIVTISSGPAGLLSSPTTSTVASGGGGFRLVGMPGWDVVTVTSPNYQPNRTWVYISDTTVNVGTIYVTPLSFVEGRVLGPSGYPINTSSVQVCQADGGGCTAGIGSGLTNTNGTYFAEVPAGHIPIGVYMITAYAPGYLSNVTWVNVTFPATHVLAPTLYLEPLVRPPAAAHLGNSRALASSVNPGAWIYGRIIDNVTDQGLPNAAIEVTPVPVGAPQLIAGVITPDGFFNFSQTLGLFWVNVTDTGYYYPLSVFIVVNGSLGALNLGTFRLDPLVTLAGRVPIEPWAYAVTQLQGVGVQSTVYACLRSLTFCGATARTDSAGFFNISAPVGRYDTVYAHANGGGLGSAANGFDQNQTSWNVTANGSGEPLVLGETIFAAYTGFIRDNSTGNTTPVRFGTVSLRTFTPSQGVSTAAETLTGGGGFAMFLSAGNVTPGAATGDAYVPKLFYHSYSYSPRDLFRILPSQDNQLPDVSLDHFGWIQFNVTTGTIPYGASTSRVAFAQLNAQVTTKNATLASSAPAQADGSGFVNMTAPPGHNLTVTVSAPDFSLLTLKKVIVNQSETSFLNGTGINQIGNEYITPWGWLSGVVWDRVALSGVNSATLTVTNTTSVATTFGAPGIVTSTNGVFFSDAPLNGTVRSWDDFVVAHPGYASNNSRFLANPGGLTYLPQVNLTGAGVVAGRVLSYPGLKPLYQAQVQVCAISSIACIGGNVTTNGSGYFWDIAPAGKDVLNITLPGYSFNLSTQNLIVPSDGWVWTGTYVLNQFATVTGVVLGTPSGAPILGANVSVCSIVALPGNPSGPCFATVTTDAIGQFSISVPAGTYILAINATNYNATYIPISLSAGELVALGTIFLGEFGFAAGVVLGADTNAAIPGTLVQGCPLWNAGNCTSTARADAQGRFRVGGAPGAYVIVASAPGYQIAYVSAVVVSGVTTALLPTFLTPVGTNLMYTLQGTVVGGGSLAPIAGAVVDAGASYATATNASGGFSFPVPWGTYRLSAAANGFVTESRLVSVHHNLFGLNFVLPQTTYPVTGTIRDGLTSNPIANAQVFEAGILLTTSNAFGSFTFGVPNGTYTFQVIAPSALASLYGSVGFSAAISGGGVSRDVTLFPAAASVYGLVVSSYTGAPLANATVSAQGTADGLPWSGTYVSTVLGTFVARLYVGSYTLTATAAGYVTNHVTISPADNSSLTVSIFLTPLSTAPSVTGGGAPGFGPILVVVGVAAVGVAAYLSLGRLRAGTPELGRRPAAPGSSASPPPQLGGGQ